MARTPQSAQAEETRTPEGIVWTVATLTEVALCKGLDMAEVTLKRVTCDNPEALSKLLPEEDREKLRAAIPTTYYEVNVTKFRATAQGLRAGDTHRRTIRDPHEASAYANKRFARLAAQGWRRTA